MFARALVVFALACLQASAAAPPIAGDWLGVLRPPNSEVQLRILLHVKAADDGALSATMDSLDQGANGIPVTSVTLAKDGAFEMKVDAVQGSYSGRFDAAARTIRGSWSQGMGSIPLDFSPRPAGGKEDAAATPAARPSDVDGDWEGAIETGMQKLRLLVHIRSMSDGLRLTMDSLDQGAKGIPATRVRREGNSFNFEVAGIGGAYDGTTNADKTVIDGVWKQGGAELPLKLTRVKPAK